METLFEVRIFEVKPILPNILRIQLQTKYGVLLFMSILQGVIYNSKSGWFYSNPVHFT